MIPLVFFSLITTVSAFISTPGNICRAASKHQNFDFGRKELLFGSKRIDTQTLNAVSINPFDAVLTASIYGAAVYATVYVSQNGGLAKKGKEVIETLEAVKTAEIETLKAEVEEVIEDGEQILEEAGEQILERVGEKILEEVAEKAIETEADIISNMKRKVTSTLEGEKEKIERLKSKVGIENEETQDISKDLDGDCEEEPNQDTKITSDSPGRFWRLKKIFKKILLPWKKWSDL